MNGHFELINLMEGTVTRWKTPETLRLELGEIADDFKREWEATQRRFELIKAALAGAGELRKAGIMLDVRLKAEKAAAEVIAKIDGKPFVETETAPIAEMIAAARHDADRLRARHGDAALKALHVELDEALAKVTRDRDIREEEHREQVRKTRHFAGGWYSQPAYAGNFAAMPMSTDKNGHVVADPMHPALRRRMH